MRTKTILVVAAVVLLAASVAPALAHHAFNAEFDATKPIKFQGTVTKMLWVNPHAWIYVDVTDDKGQTVNWSFELPSPVTLMRRGWTRDSLKPGDHIKVTGAPAKNYPTIAIGNFVRDSSGKPLFTGTTQVYTPESESK